MDPCMFYHRTCGAACAATLAIATATVGEAPASQYSIGEPTAKEQLYVELINRARANPTAEGVWLASLNDAAKYPNIVNAYNQFGVNLALMQDEFVTGSPAGKPVLQAAPPLAINAKLTAAARLHSLDQLNNDFQGHVGSNGSTLGQRITAQGYNWAGIGENVYASSRHVIFGHAGFQVDWGGNDGTGMQGPPRGHRSAIHSTSYREIGVGNITSAEATIPAGNTSAKGPEVCTQEFGRQQGAVPFITGVAYYDLNGNNFYDLGEGLGGVHVACSGTSTYAVTSTSGGYAIPVPGNGSYTVTFSPTGAASPTDFGVTVTGGQNVKQDLVLSYSPPSVSGPSPMAMEDTRTFTISSVPGASSYTWIGGYVDSTPADEDADSGSHGYSLDTSSNYAPIQSSVRVSGNAFRLIDSPVGASGFKDQILVIEREFTALATSYVGFQSRFTWQASGQHAKVQVSDDGGQTWQDTDFDQPGPMGEGESAFFSRSADLSAFAGKSVRIRFILEYQSGSIYSIDPNNGFTSGWYIDNITFNDLEEIISSTESTVSAGNTFQFTPLDAGTYRMRACANLQGGSLPFGDSFDLTITESDLTAWLINNPSASGGSLADPEQDGASNLVEYAFALDPGIKDSHLIPIGTNTATHYVFSATRPSYAHGDIIYEIQRTDDLNNGTWATVKTFSPGEPLSYSEPLNSSGTNRFYRWKITFSP